jgi:hypothetical protein
MTDYPAISGLDDASNGRVMLLQSGRLVQAPVLSIGLQPLDADLTSWAAITRASGFDAFVATPSSANLAALVTNESGSDQLLFGTPWVAYTPTFTGWGTVTTVSVFSRRIGDTLQVQGRWTAGITTGVEARMTIGFNGVNGGITADATKVATTRLAGTAIRTAAAAGSFYILMESGIGYVTFGFQDAANGALNTKQLGNAIAATGQIWALVAEIPISGW